MSSSKCICTEGHWSRTYMHTCTNVCTGSYTLSLAAGYNNVNACSWVHVRTGSCLLVAAGRLRVCTGSYLATGCSIIRFAQQCLHRTCICTCALLSLTAMQAWGLSGQSAMVAYRMIVKDWWMVQVVHQLMPGPCCMPEHSKRWHDISYCYVKNTGWITKYTINFIPHEFTLQKVTKLHP